MRKHIILDIVIHKNIIYQINVMVVHVKELYGIHLVVDTMYMYGMGIHGHIFGELVIIIGIHG